jgi:hypothetical protein
MIDIEVVTGYTPIPSHPRHSGWYHEHGKRFAEVAKIAPVRFMPGDLDRCWLYKYLYAHGLDPVPAIDDNPDKNTVAYHVVQHQKFAALAIAAGLSGAETMVWIDYGIFGAIPGITADVVRNFLTRIGPDDFAIPGCWPRSEAKISDDIPCWRFCGGVIVVPRKQVLDLYSAVRGDVTMHIVLTGCLSWEVNTLARCEQNGTINPRWYQADHNERMFTGY